MDELEAIFDEIVLENSLRKEEFMMAFAYLSIVLGAIKSILEVMLYMSGIFVSFKAVQALNVYINKNSNKYE